MGVSMINSIIWKNNVNVHAPICHTSFKQGKRSCGVCKKDIGDFETVLYCFLGRGTQFSNISCIHAECEPSCTTTKVSKHYPCRLCGKKGGVDGVIPLRWGRKFFYHRSCLFNIKSEITPIEQIHKLAIKRIKDRFMKATTAYYIKLDFPYTGLLLEEDEGNHQCNIKLHVRSIDGKMVWCFADLYNNRFWLFDKSWKPHSFIEKNLNGDERTKEVFWAVLSDLEKFYDNNGFPLGLRPDIDFKMRFLLKHGCSMEGALERALEEIETQYKEIRQSKN